MKTTLKETERNDHLSDSDVRKILSGVTEEYTKNSGIILSFTKDAPTEEDRKNGGFQATLSTVIAGQNPVVLALFKSILSGANDILLAQMYIAMQLEIRERAQKLRAEMTNQNQ